MRLFQEMEATASTKYIDVNTGWCEVVAVLSLTEAWWSICCKLWNIKPETAKAVPGHPNQELGVAFTPHAATVQTALLRISSSLAT